MHVMYRMGTKQYCTRVKLVCTTLYKEWYDINMYNQNNFFRNK